MGGVWSDRTRCVRKRVGSVGHFDRSPNSDRSDLSSAYVNISSNEHDLLGLCAGSWRCRVLKCAKRSDRSDKTFRSTDGVFRPVCCNWSGSTFRTNPLKNHIPCYFIVPLVRHTIKQHAAAACRSSVRNCKRACV